VGIPLTDFFTAVLIGVGLAMDAAAVSMTGGANAKTGSVAKAALLAALFFGAFQFGMLYAGGVGGEALKRAVSDIDHWVAFFLLCAVGGKMLLESRRAGGEDTKANLLDARILLVLALATSIDALAVGVGVAFADHSLIETAIIVGVATATISFFSVFIGSRFGCKLGGRAEVLGGAVLILIGLNILRTHLGLF
jgi:manganese efflux pump family protein